MINAQEWLQYKNNKFEDSFASLCSDDKNTLSLKKLIITKKLADKITPDIYYMGLYSAIENQAQGIFNTLLNTMIKNNIEYDYSAMRAIGYLLVRHDNLASLVRLNEKTNFIQKLLGAPTHSFLEENKDFMAKIYRTADMSKIKEKIEKHQNDYSIYHHLFENACACEKSEIIDFFMKTTHHIDLLALTQGFWIACNKEDICLVTSILSSKKSRHIIKNNEEIQQLFLNFDAKNRSPFLMQVSHLLDALENKENLQKEIQPISPDAHRVISKI